MKRFKLSERVLLAFLIALILLLGATPLGMIPLGFINVTILCVPVLVGTLLMGLKSGLMLGAAFGAISFFSALFKPSALVATLMAANPFLVAVMCFLPRLIVPVTAFFTYRAMQPRNGHVAAAVASVVGSLTNTVLYLGLMLLFYILCGIDAAPILGLIGGTAAIAGSCEAAVAAILVAPILVALKRLRKR